MQVFREIGEAVDLEDVVETELTTRNRLLPPRWGDVALAHSQSLVADWLKSIMRRELTADPEQAVLARKLGRGARPLSFLGLRDRLVYRSCVSLIQAETNEPLRRSQDDHETFLNAPLGVRGCRYVFKTDIAAYYQYIDHERLVDEVVAQIGDDLAASMAVEILREASGRAYGLPQLSSASDVLAEIYIEPMRRELARSGFTVFRFADDFRVACRSYEQALAAWEVADAAARELGLVLNEGKTGTPTRKHYKESLTAVRDQERMLFSELEVEELDEPEYADSSDDHIDSLLDESEFDEGDVVIGNGDGDETSKGDVTAAQLTAAERVLERWNREDEDEEAQRREEAQVNARLLGRALRVFTAAESATALESIPAVLVYEPSLTPTVGRYLRACSKPHRAAVRDTLDEVCKSGIVNGWQAMWIAYVAGELPRRRGGGNLPHVTWLKQQLTGKYEAVAAEAALALARRRLIGSDAIGALLSRISAVHQPTLVVAAAALGDDGAAMSMAASELDRARVTWALEHL